MRRCALPLIGLLLAASAWAQVSVYQLPGRYIPGRPGAGVDADMGAVLGLYVKAISASGDTLTVVFQDSSDTEDTLTYTPSASTDDVVDAISFDEDTSMLTVSTTAGDDYTADLSDLSTGAFTDLSDTPSSLTADLCVKGNSSGDALVFGACLSSGTADGVVESGSVSGTTLTLVRSVGASVHDYRPAGDDGQRNRRADRDLRARHPERHHRDGAVAVSERPGQRTAERERFPRSRLRWTRGLPPMPACRLRARLPRLSYHRPTRWTRSCPTCRTS